VITHVMVKTTVMKRKYPAFGFLLILMVLSLLHSRVKAQSPIDILREIPARIDSNGIMQKGRSYIKAGLGFPNLLFTVSKAASGLLEYNTKKKGLQTYTLSYDYAVKNNVTIGAFVSYAAGEYRYTEKGNEANYYGYKGSFLTICGRTTYHFKSTKSWDIYSGVNAGVSISKINYFSNGVTQNILNFLGGSSSIKAVPSIVYNAFVGASKYFTNHLGIYAELGYGITVVKAGAAYYF
jgi:hypothetical protein